MINYNDGEIHAYKKGDTNRTICDEPGHTLTVDLSKIDGGAGAYKFC